MLTAVCVRVRVCERVCVRACGGGDVRPGRTPARTHTSFITILTVSYTRARRMPNTVYVRVSA